MSEFSPGDRVEILAGGPHENMGRIATVNSVQENGDLRIYLNDGDGDEWVYSPGELRKVQKTAWTVSDIADVSIDPHGGVRLVDIGYDLVIAAGEARELAAVLIAAADATERAERR